MIQKRLRSLRAKVDKTSYGMVKLRAIIVENIYYYHI